MYPSLLRHQLDSRRINSILLGNQIPTEIFIWRLFLKVLCVY